MRGQGERWDYDAVDRRTNRERASAERLDDGSVALALITAMASDNVITAAEKLAVLIAYHDLIDGQTALATQAAAFDPDVPYADFNTKLTALSNYFVTTLGMTDEAVWRLTSTAIDGAVFRAKFSDAYAARTALINAIAERNRTQSEQGITLANGRNRAWFQDTQPDAATPGIVNNSPLVAGDKWFYTVTVTQADTTTETRKALKQWTGAAWADVEMTTRVVASMIDAGEIVTAHLVAGLINAIHISADALVTTNYEAGSDAGGEYAIHGGKLRRTAGLGSTEPALLVDSYGFRIGVFRFKDYFFRLINGMDGGPASTGGSGLVWYRGNCDLGALAGAPNINCLKLYNRWAMYDGGTWWSWHGWEWEIQPTAASDNLDGLRYVKISFWLDVSKTAYAGNAGNGDTALYFPVTDRVYYNKATHTDANNYTKGSFIHMFGRQDGRQSATTGLYNGYTEATLYNAYGPSASVMFNSPVNRTTALTQYSAPSGGGGGGGGGGEGGGCPTPDMRILMVGGEYLEAGKLVDGMQVLGLDERDLYTPAVGTVRHPHPIKVQATRVEYEEGFHTDFSFYHRLGVLNKGWVAVQDLTPGDILIAQRPATVRSVTPLGERTVITFKVDGPSTYFTEDVLSHNVKMEP